MYNIMNIFRKQKVYKCIAYIDDGTKDKLVDAFEIKEYTEQKAYNMAFDIMKLKYPNMGLDIRISKK